MNKEAGMQSMKPIVEGVSNWDSCTEILYKCPKCNTSFRILSHHEKFCHNCGQKINWNVPRYLKEPRTGWIQRQELIDLINSLVQSEEYGDE